MPFLAIPLWAWLVGGGAVAGATAAVLATDATQDYTDAAQATANTVGSVTKLLLVAGALYAAWSYRDEIKDLLK